MQRAGQALTEHDFVGQLLTIDKKADVVVVGDLNDYQVSDHDPQVVDITP